MPETIDTSELRALARQFAQEQLRPHVEKWDADRRLGDDVVPQLAELGFFGMVVPDEHGGLDLDLPGYVAVLEELSWGEAGVGLTVSIHGVVAHVLGRHGTDAQKAAWLPKLAAGDAIAAFALSEENAGSDAGAVETRARRDGDGWVLDGTKKWVTNASIAGLTFVVARTSDAPGAKGLSVFLVPGDVGGLEVTGRETTMGLRTLDVSTVRLDGVRVGEDALLGDEGAGFRYAMEGLDLGRMGIAAQATGIAQAALEHATRYAGEREQFGQPIREFEAIQFKLANMATRTEAARALLRRAAGEPSTARSAMAKLFASETAMFVTTEAVQIFGGYGYMRDYPVEKLMRDAKATEIYEGTNEIQRVVIARELYR